MTKLCVCLGMLVGVLCIGITVGWADEASASQSSKPHLRVVLNVRSRVFAPENPAASSLSEADRRPITAEELDETVRVLQARVAAYGLSESPAMVEAGARNRLVLSIPCAPLTPAQEAGLRDLLTTWGDVEFLGIPRQYAFGEGGVEVNPNRGGDIFIFLDSNGREAETDSVIRSSERLALSRSHDFEPTSRVISDPGRPTGVTFELKEPARTKFEQYTRSHIGCYIAMAFEYRILACPVIKSSCPGKGLIMSDYFDGPNGLEMAKRVSVVLNSGPLPLEVEWVESEFVAAK
jgi:preprotein translocase subunit SecD